MANTNLLAKLLHAVATQDWTTARSIGTRIAEVEEGKGHHDAARTLRAALISNGHGGSGMGEWLGDPAFLSGALTKLSNAARLKDVTLRPAQLEAMDGVISEWKGRALLKAHGIEPRQKLLFFGPPGCGKSLTAQALGNELHLPTYVIRIDAVVGPYLGQTALRIRQLFHFAEITPCVLLLDEIDALGKQRGNQLDVGEIDRVVISLMQELEHSRPQGLIIATSNLPRQLDEALFRRFDHEVHFPRPTASDLRRFATKRIATRRLVPRKRLRSLLSGATSFADAEQRIVAAERALILQTNRRPRG